MNLGIDFGSTYTVLSAYDATTGQVDAIEHNNSTNIPSVVSHRGSDPQLHWEYGVLAKKNTGKKDREIFKAFKMLLPENNEQILQERGYTQYSPADITARFLDNCLTTGLQKFKEEKIEHLVICAPEIWSAAIHTADGRPILRDICKKFPYVNTVQVVSEPAAASAFFAFNFEKNAGRPFDGHILLVDYGGGTLDITLTKVYNRGDGRVEIKVLKRNGAGENENGRVGQAGVAYMEDVVTQAILRAGLDPKEHPTKFLRAVDELEDQLRCRATEIQGYFDMMGLDDPGISEDLFVDDLEYNGEELAVSYGDLVSSYQKVIQPVLQEKLKFITDYMDKKRISYSDKAGEDFKIACVGGFGTYYLVEHQINSIFHFAAMDGRRTNIINAVQERERAVSYGAALISSGVISIKCTAPYSVGIYAKRADGKVSRNFAISLRQDIEYGHPYFQCFDNGEKMIFFVPNGAISSLIINTGADLQGTIRAPIRDEFRERLQNLVTGMYKAAHVGFSLDQSEVLSIHVEEYDFVHNQVGQTRVIELSRFNDLLATSVIELVGD